MFRALGVESDADIVRCIVPPGDAAAELLANELVGCMDECSGCRSTRAAQEYLAHHLALPHHQQQYAHSQSKAHRVNALRSVLRKDLLPHVGPEPHKKALYLGHMVNRLLKCHLGLRPLDDRDSYVNKRLDTPGVLLANLFRQYYGKVVKDARTLIQKDINAGAWRATKQFINVLGKSNVYKVNFSLSVGSLGRRPLRGLLSRAPHRKQKFDQNRGCAPDPHPVQVLGVLGVLGALAPCRPDLSHPHSYTGDQVDHHRGRPQVRSRHRKLGRQDEPSPPGRRSGNAFN